MTERAEYVSKVPNRRNILFDGRDFLDYFSHSPNPLIRVGNAAPNIDCFYLPRRILLAYSAHTSQRGALLSQVKIE